MADEPTLTTQVTQSEVIGLGNNAQGSTPNNLASLFEKMEAGKAEGREVKDVISEETKKPDIEQNKPEEKKPEETPIQKKEPEEKKVEKAEKDDKPDDPREVLKRAMEERAARKKEQQPEEKKPEEKKVDDKTEAKKGEDDVPEEELQVLPHDKPNTVKRIKALLQKIEKATNEVTSTKRERDEKAVKLSELEKKLGEVKTVNPETDAQVKQQLDELAMLRRRYELDKDPTVKAKFDDRVNVAEQSITDILKKYRASDGLLEIIKNEGGWAKFALSNNTMEIPDGQNGMKVVTHAELADMVLGKLPLGDRKAIESSMLEQFTTKRERDRYFKEEQDKASEFFKKRDEEQQKASQAQQEYVANAQKTIEAWKTKVLSSDGFKDKEVPANATADQKADIEQWNAYNKQLRSLINKNLSVKTVDEALEVQLDAIKYYEERRTSDELRRENERLKAEIEAQKKEMTKFKTAGRSVSKAGSIAVVSASPSNSQDKKPRGLEAAFDMLERGEKLDGSESDE